MSLTLSIENGSVFAVDDADEVQYTMSMLRAYFIKNNPEMIQGLPEPDYSMYQYWLAQRGDMK